ncbi:aminoglycoside phosphotransferase family protein [Chryseobacterium sp. MYb264]|uniref:phosphotransferase enzyme family protein n=1 Tax=Chryseobacterium sp. MYb264 TaxID=2745153 RepID=UPI002E123540|nr:aminoglycoside phosphotransferase family protein [Chryseobacterium sp. MYb264]
MELKNIVQEFTDTENYTITPITNGMINSTYLLENNDKKEKYILQKINIHIFKDPKIIIDNHLKINSLLGKSNYQLEMVNPIHSISNKYLVQNENSEIWRMLSFIENSKTFLKVPDLKTAYEAAKTFGYFLDIINSEPILSLQETLPDFINFEKRINDYKNALQNTSQDLAKTADQEIKYINQLLELPEKWIEMEKNHLLPKRIIHADPKISNILFDQNDNPLAVIDLDTTMISTILYDFGDMIRSYTNKTDEDQGNSENNFDSEIYKAVKDGFLFHLKEKLTTLETENLNYAAQVVIYIQAVRFLTDYLNGNIYYSTQYPEHNLDRTKNQLMLLRGLREYLNDTL